ncbi:MAG: hypothetical protein CCU26_09435 [Nitrospira sp. UW-LDO-01]|nr:MAG: hypothetical protein CCU26_09435 [Nitrospira sp. UW-LDO-01]
MQDESRISKLAVTLTVVLTGLTLSCTKYDQEIKLEDVRKSQGLVLRKTASGPVYSIAIRGRGTISGRARVTLMEEGSLRKTETLEGRVNFQWGGDWYGDTAELQYEPINVTGGDMVIDYSFATLE